MIRGSRARLTGPGHITGQSQDYPELGFLGYRGRGWHAGAKKGIYHRQPGEFDVHGMEEMDEEKDENKEAKSTEESYNEQEGRAGQKHPARDLTVGHRLPSDDG